MKKLPLYKQRRFLNSIRCSTHKWTQNEMCCGYHVLFVLSPPILYTSPATLQSTSACLALLNEWEQWMLELQQQHISVLKTGRFQHWQGITWIRDSRGKLCALQLWQVRSQCWCVPAQPVQNIPAGHHHATPFLYSPAAQGCQRHGWHGLQAQPSANRPCSPQLHLKP